MKPFFPQHTICTVCLCVINAWYNYEEFKVNKMLWRIVWQVPNEEGLVRELRTLLSIPPLLTLILIYVPLCYHDDTLTLPTQEWLGKCTIKLKIGIFTQCRHVSHTWLRQKGFLWRTSQKSSSINSDSKCRFWAGGDYRKSKTENKSKNV